MIEDTRPPFAAMLITAGERARIRGEDEKSHHH
jgi:hypothetical protein